MQIILDKKLRRRFKPLQPTFSMTVVGGSVAQLHDADNNIFYPDREITELMIQPVLNIADPDKAISDGNKNDAFIQIRWTQVVNGVESPVDENFYEVVTSARNGLMKGALIVRKNVPYLTPTSLIFHAEFFDPRTGTTLKFDETILLRTTSVASLLLVTQLDKANQEICNPMNLTDINCVITPSFFLGKDKLTDFSKIGLWWKIVTSDSELSCNKANHIAILSSTAKGVLSVDKRCVEKLLLRLYSAYFPDANIPANPPANANINEVLMLRKFPANLAYKQKVGANGLISSSATQTVGQVLAHDGKGYVENLDETHSITWQTKRSSAGTSFKDVARGQTAILPVADGDNDTDVRAVVNQRPAYTADVTEKGERIVDENGNNILIVW
jgi:hypothetical protein